VNIMSRRLRLRLGARAIAAVGVPALLLVAIAAGAPGPGRVIRAQAKAKPAPKKAGEAAEKKGANAEAVGLARWKKASPKTTPTVTNSANFVLFSTLPKDRASTTVRAVQGAYPQIRALFGQAAVDWGKAGLFVFHDAASYGEFVKTTDGRSPAEGETGMAKFDVAEPYAAVIDPQGGRESKPAATATAKKVGRSKRGRAAAAVPASVEPTLNARLLEQVVAGVGSKAGKPPRWLTLGIADRLARTADRRSPYYRKILRDAAGLSEQGWITRATDALGGESNVDDQRAVGYVIVLWLAAKDRLAAMTKELMAGGDKLDDAIANVFENGTREDFLKAVDPARAMDQESEDGAMDGMPDFFPVP
jgi:hypothetical protein